MNQASLADRLFKGWRTANGMARQLRQVAADRPLGREEAVALVVRRPDAAQRFLLAIGDVTCTTASDPRRANLPLLVLGHQLAEALPLRQVTLRLNSGITPTWRSRAT